MTGFNKAKNIVLTYGMFFLYGALIFTIWPGLDCFIKARKFLLL